MASNLNSDHKNNENNKWQNQRIHQHFKNCHTPHHVDPSTRYKPYNSSKRKSNGPRLTLKKNNKGYKDLCGPNLRVYNKNMNIEIFCRDYDNSRIDIDDEYDSNDNDEYYIEPWTCSVCTYYNSSNHIKCEICNAANTNYQSTANSNMTLGDFLPSTNHENNTINNYNEDDMTQIAIQLSLTENINKNKHFEMNNINESDIHQLRISNKETNTKNNKLRDKFINSMSSLINYFCAKEFSRKYTVECMIDNDYWIKQILQMSSLELVYTVQVKPWQEIVKQIVEKRKLKDYSNRINDLKSLFNNHPLIKLCEIGVLCHGFLRSNDHNIIIPDDVVNITMFFCGIVSRLLPFGQNNDNQCIDIDTFDIRTTTQKLTVFASSSQAKSELIWTKYGSNDNEMFICIKLDGKLNKTSFYDRGYKYYASRTQFANILPIFKIKCVAMSFWNHHQLGTVQWNGWIAKYQKENECNDKNKDELIDRNENKLKQKNKIIFGIDDVDNKNILKYAKTRNEKRYVQRKWSAYTKLNR